MQPRCISLLIDPALRCGFQVLLFENCVMLYFIVNRLFTENKLIIIIIIIIVVVIIIINNNNNNNNNNNEHIKHVTTRTRQTHYLAD